MQYDNLGEVKNVQLYKYDGFFKDLINIVEWRNVLDEISRKPVCMKIWPEVYIRDSINYFFLIGFVGKGHVDFNMTVKIKPTLLYFYIASKG